VDDIASIVNRRKIKTTLDSFNSFHPEIQFTIEVEEDRKLPFLDVLLNRKDDGSFKFSIYRKKTHTDKYLNYHSHHYYSQKIEVIDSLAFRAFKICDEDAIGKVITTLRINADCSNAFLE